MTRELLALLAIGLFARSALSATINFSGPLIDVDVDDGSGVYANTPLGTQFSGDIDDQTFNGSITRLDFPDPGDDLTTSFTCCVAAGGISFDNDIELLAADAADLNALAGKTVFAEGDIIDLIDIEGDELLPGGNRIEVGLSYILDSSAFDAPGTYPFDLNKRKLTLFFIVESDGLLDVYNALGRDFVVPLPASVWLFGSALGLLSLARRSATRASAK